MLIPVKDFEVLKKTLATLIVDHGRNSKLTQKAMAEKIGITQPRYSNLANGKIDKFSLDALLSFVLAMDVDAALQIDIPEVAPVQESESEETPAEAAPTEEVAEVSEQAEPEAVEETSEEVVDTVSEEV